MNTGVILNWTANEIRQLRHRMGWSQAELARCLSLEQGIVSAWETGSVPPKTEHRHVLIRILRQADDHSEKVQRRPVAEVMMRDQHLSQIHDHDVSGINDFKKI